MQEFHFCSSIALVKQVSKYRDHIWAKSQIKDFMMVLILEMIQAILLS